MAVAQKVWVVFEKDVTTGVSQLVGSRLTLEAAVGLCKCAPNRYWQKTTATKEAGPSKFDINP